MANDVAQIIPPNYLFNELEKQVYRALVAAGYNGGSGGSGGGTGVYLTRQEAQAMFDEICGDVDHLDAVAVYMAAYRAAQETSIPGSHVSTGEPMIEEDGEW